MLIQPSQADVRRFFCGVYAKAQTAAPLEPMEMLVSQWIDEHPQYHAQLADVDAALRGRVNLQQHVCLGAHLGRVRHSAALLQELAEVQHDARVEVAAWRLRLQVVGKVRHLGQHFDRRIQRVHGVLQVDAHLVGLLPIELRHGAACGDRGLLEPVEDGRLNQLAPAALRRWRRAAPASTLGNNAGCAMSAASRR